MNRSRHRLPTTVTTVTTGLLLGTLMTVVVPSPTEAAVPGTLGHFDHISAIATLGTTTTALFGAADNASNAGQLWRSDGTAAGTALVTVTNTEGGEVEEIVPLDATRSVFRARANGQGTELWVTDGTPAGTQVVRDVRPGPNSSNPHDFAQMGGKLYFTADDGVHGRELWVTDGTEAGTNLVKEIRPGSSPVGPSSLTVSGDLIFLAADDGLTGVELWRTDGTPGGTHLVKDIESGPLSSHPHLVAFDGGVVFGATDSTDGREMWFSDGTGPGTVRITDLRPGTAWPSLTDPVVVGDRVIFGADDGVTGIELWGVRRRAGAWVVAQVADVRPGPGGSNPSGLIAAGNRLYFIAYDEVHGGELWRSDGTTAGTTLVRDLEPGPGGSGIWGTVAFRSHLIFTATTSADGWEAWVSDGTAVGTMLVDGGLAPGSADSTPELLHVVGTTLLHKAYDTVDDTYALQTLDLAAWFTGNAGVPSIAGTARVGRSMTVAPGAWDSGTVFQYRWLRNGSPIPGATGRTYVTTARDHRAALTVRVTGARPDYTPLTRVAAGVTVAAGKLRRPRKPVVVGKPLVGRKLQAKPHKWEAGVRLRFRWLRNGKPIRGKLATKRSYTLKRIDRRKRISVRVTATRPGYDAATIRSRVTARVR